MLKDDISNIINEKRELRLKKRRDYYQKNKEKMLLQRKLYRERNKEKIKARYRNPEYNKKVKEYQKERYQRNKIKINTNNKIWRLNNPEKVKIAQTKWVKNNKDKIKASRIKNLSVRLKWLEKNKEKVKEYSKKAKNNVKKRMRSDPEYKARIYARLKKYKETHKHVTNAKHRKNILELNDNYVKMLIISGHPDLRFKDISKEFVDTYKLNLKLKRTIKQLKEEINE